MQNLNGQVAVVTGASRGIGLAVARGLHAAGGTISVWSRRPETAPDTLRGPGFHLVACDIRRRVDVEAAVASTVDRLGGIDVLVANAGRRSELRSVLDVDAEVVEEILETNLHGTFWTMQAVARQMVAQGRGGKIVAISSVRATQGAALGAVYAASKSGVEGLVRSMALALAPHDIQVNAVRPGWTATGMTDELRADPVASADFLRHVPAHRFADPAELVGAVAYLASSAASFHTGDVLTVDGGLTAGAAVDGTQLFDPAYDR